MFLSSNVKGAVHTGNMKTLSLSWCCIAHASSRESTCSLRPLPILKLNGAKSSPFALPYLFTLPILPDHTSGRSPTALLETRVSQDRVP